MSRLKQRVESLEVSMKEKDDEGGVFFITVNGEIKFQIILGINTIFKIPHNDGMYYELPDYPRYDIKEWESKTGILLGR